MTDEEIEAEAIRIHNESELKQEEIWKRRGHHCTYVPMSWEDTKEGFYKNKVRIIAVRNLNKGKNDPIPKRRIRKKK